MTVSWNPNSIIAGLYEVKGLVGQGGMGTVYRVRHLNWNIDLAVKTPSPEVLEKEEGAERFQEREAYQWVRLGLHPNIASCFYVRTLDDGIPRLFIEFVEGGSLKEWMAKGKIPDLATALDVGIQICWGVGWAHKRGLVHLDIKPDNVLMTPDGIPKVTDFGLVKAADSSSAKVETGGTPGYAAPEQFREGSDLSAQADVYALGVVLYELLQTFMDWQIFPQATARARPVFYAKELKNHNHDLSDVLLNCIALNPEKRYTDAASLAVALTELYPSMVGTAYSRKTPNEARVLADGFNNLALSMLDLGRPDEAEQMWKQAQKADPQHLETVFNWNLTRLRHKKITVEEFLLSLQTVQTAHPGYWLAPYLLGLAHLERRCVEAALPYLEQAAQLVAAGGDKAAKDGTTEAEMMVQQARAMGGLAHTFGGQRHYLNERSYSICLSANGRYALLGGEESLRLWDVETLECLCVFKGHTEYVRSVCLSTDGRFALSGSWDKTMRSWDVATGECLRVFIGHEAPVNSVCLSADGRFALSGSGNGPSSDNTLRLWDVATGECLRVFKGHTNFVESVCLSTDGRFALSGSADKNLRLWDVATGKCLRIFGGHAGGVNSVCLNTDGHFALSGGSWDKKLRLWDVATGRCLRIFRGHTEGVNSVCLSADGHFALSGSDDKTLRLWDVKTGRGLLRLLTIAKSGRLRVFEGHTNGIFSVSLSADGRFALSASHERPAGATGQHVRLWDVATGECLRVLEAHHKNGVKSVCLSTDGRFALSGSSDYSLRLWNVATRECLRTFEGHVGSVNSVCLSADSRFALSGSGDKTLRLWDVATGKCLRVFDGHKKDVKSVCLSTDGRFALSGSGDKTLRLWDVATGECLRVFEGHENGVVSVSLSTDRRFALSGSDDKTLRLWDVATGECLRVFEGHKNDLTSVCLSTDSRFALSGSGDKTLRLWDVTTGECLRIFEGHEDPVTSVSFSMDRRFALSGGGRPPRPDYNDEGNCTFRLWNVATGECLRVFEGHENLVTSVSFSTDGSFALSGSNDTTLRLWEIASTSCPLISPRLSFVRPYSDVIDSADEVEQLVRAGEAALSTGAWHDALDLFRAAKRIPGHERSARARDGWNAMSNFASRSELRAGGLVRVFEGHTDEVRSVCLSSDGRFALSGSFDQTLRLWDVATGKCLRTIDAGVVTSVCLSADGRFALSGGQRSPSHVDDKGKATVLVESIGSLGAMTVVDKGSTLHLWDVETGECLRVFKGHTGIIKSVCLSSDGRFALSGSVDQTLRLWDVATGECLRVFEGHQAWVNAVCLSADGRFALSGGGHSPGSDITLRLWDVATGECLRIFRNQVGSVLSVCLNVDSRFALSGGDTHAESNYTLQMWEVATGRRLRIFEGHTDHVHSVSLSVDNRFALSGSNDKTLRLWKVATGECLRIFKGHTDDVNSVCLSIDGCWALSGSSDKTLRLWDLEWELEMRDPADWDEGALPYLQAFLTQQTPSRKGQLLWTEADFERLIRQLQYASYGWLRPEGVRRKLEEMARK